MGRGDKRTKKGKIFKGSFGNSRPKAVSSIPASKTTQKVVKSAAVKPAPKKKVVTKKKDA
jgi:30S ribosomal protein S31